MAIEILQSAPFYKGAEEALAARYSVQKLFAASDRATLLRDIGPRIRGIAGGSASAELISALPNLEIIAGFGVGYDSIDTAAARSRGIRVTNTPDVLTDAVAEITIALMLALARRIPAADRFVRAGDWLKGPFPLSMELTGRTLGIIGLGRIGREVAARAQAMKMRVVYHGRQARPREPFVFYGDLLAMASDCDWLLAITPGGPGTQGLVSRAVLEALGPDGMFVNMSRGSVVDQEALVEMLVSGALGGAGLDVFAGEPKVPEALLGLENVVLSPHMGSGTHETRQAMGDLMIANLDAHFAGEPLPTAVV